MTKGLCAKIFVVLPTLVLTLIASYPYYQTVSAFNVIGSQTDDTLTGGIGHLIRCLGNGFTPRTNCVGTNQNDKIIGFNRAENIYGVDGKDYIQGFSDADVIYGGKGDDTIIPAD